MPQSGFAQIAYRENAFTGFKEFDIVPIATIFYKKSSKAHIEPDSNEDFDKSHTYLYKQCDCGNDEPCQNIEDCEDFLLLEARILSLGETEKDVEAGMGDKRKRVIRKVSSSESEAPQKGKKTGTVQEKGKIRINKELAVKLRHNLFSNQTFSRNQCSDDEQESIEPSTKTQAMNSNAPSESALARSEEPVFLDPQIPDIEKNVFIHGVEDCSSDIKTSNSNTKLHKSKQQSSPTGPPSPTKNSRPTELPNSLELPNAGVLTSPPGIPNPPLLLRPSAGSAKASEFQFEKLKNLKNKSEKLKNLFDDTEKSNSKRKLESTGISKTPSRTRSSGSGRSHSRSRTPSRRPRHSRSRSRTQSRRSRHSQSRSETQSRRSRHSRSRSRTPSRRSRHSRSRSRTQSRRSRHSQSRSETQSRRSRHSRSRSRTPSRRSRHSRSRSRTQSRRSRHSQSRSETQSRRSRHSRSRSSTRSSSQSRHSRSSSRTPSLNQVNRSRSRSRSHSRRSSPPRHQQVRRRHYRVRKRVIREKTRKCKEDEIDEALEYFRTHLDEPGNNRTVLSQINDKIYLGEGVEMDYAKYLLYKENKPPKEFFKEIVKKFWPDEILANRCQHLNQTCVVLNDQDERKALSPNKKKLSFGIFNNYLISQQKNEKEASKYLLKVTRYFTEFISNAQGKYYD